MRFAIVSDIHANLQAWNAVYADIAAQSVDKIICLGDVIGYGPQPARTLASVYEKIDAFVLGNHDAVVAGILDPGGFNDDARRMIDWTCSQLHARATSFFKKVPLMTFGETFRCAHGATVKPGKFYYLANEKVARACWKSCAEQLVFVGHTHKPCVHTLDNTGAYTLADSKSFRMLRGYRYAVNVGSVGMPRDRDFRASYCIYDEDEQVVRFRRVAFDLEAFRVDVQQQIGDSRQAGMLLSCFESRAHRTTRQSIDFSPDKSRGAEATAPARAVVALRKKASRWQMIAVAAMVLLVAGAVLAITMYPSGPGRKIIRSTTRRTLNIARAGTNQETAILPAPAHAPAPDAALPPPGMTYVIGHANKQKIRMDASGLHLASRSSGQNLEVIFPSILMGNYRKLQLKLQGRKLPGCKGELPILAIDYIDADNNRVLRARTKNLVDKDGILSAQYTFKVRKDVKAVRPRLVGAFLGEIILTRFTVTPRAAGRSRKSTSGKSRKK